MLQIKHGGLTQEADTEDINLAYKLEDGIKIHIPSKQEKEKEKNSNPSETLSNELKNDSTILNNISNSNQKLQNPKVNINTATQAQLETLSGIGPSTAMKIIAYRQQNGKFGKIEDIKEVSGIGDGKFEKIKNCITVK